jgi:hypothetical protein
VSERVTLDELLLLAAEVAHTYRCYPPASPERRLSQGVLDIFGEALPCGWETPSADGGLVNVPSDLAAHLHVFKLEPQEARALAAAIARAADDAEAPR